MAATAWVFYNDAKKKIGDSTIALDAGIPKMSLHTSAASANAINAVLSVLGSIGSEIAATGGYAAGGATMAGIAWTTAGNPSSVKWDATDLVFSANGGDLTNVKYAIIHFSNAAITSGHLLCWSKLSSNQFTVTSGNTLTIQFAAAGIFTLT